ncbi:hypothetical protein F5884DRAFT_865733 [Xylogone sp. PMI_703]|nr:hypothetical protein F5884DRAFT_865733 [Xylogone sp. PMI_703]
MTDIADMSALKLDDLEEFNHERRHWYHGLSNDDYINPILLARSSNHAFQYKNHTFSGAFPTREEPPAPKNIYPVGDHDIITGYNNTTRLGVRNCLRDIPWYTIDIFRIGYSTKALENPVVVLITADIASTNVDDAQKAVNDVHNLMILNGWDDVHAEIKGGVLSTIADGKVPLQVPHIGTSVGIRETPQTKVLTGTLPCFIRVDNETLGLTCHHCVKADDDMVVTSEILVDQPSTADLNRNIQEIKAEIGATRVICQSHDEAEQKSLILDRPWSEGRKRAVEADRTLLRDLTESLCRMETFVPFFGKVARVSGISQDDRSGSIRDWALISLDKNRFNSREPWNLNFNPPTFEVSLRDRTIITTGGHTISSDFTYEEITKVVTSVEIEQALKRTGSEGHMDMMGMRVLKHGRTSGWIGGSLNQIRSDCRRGSLITTELCIINLPGTKPFSSGGDSGSLVFDIHGRVVAMLHSANRVGDVPVTRSNEITYATPMEWLLQDIRRDMGAHSVTIDLCHNI